MLRHPSVSRCCLVNALTIPNLVHILRMDRTSELIKQTIVQALKELRTKQHEMIRRLKKDPILATAHWSFVEKAIDIQSPFAGNPEELLPSENLLSRRYMDQVTCEHCQAHVTVPISKFEFKQTFEDCRIRILRSVMESGFQFQLRCSFPSDCRRLISGPIITTVSCRPTVCIH